MNTEILDTIFHVLIWAEVFLLLFTALIYLAGLTTRWLRQRKVARMEQSADPVLGKVVREITAARLPTLAGR